MSVASLLATKVAIPAHQSLSSTSENLQYLVRNPFHPTDLFQWGRTVSVEVCSPGAAKPKYKQITAPF